METNVAGPSGVPEESAFETLARKAHEHSWDPDELPWSSAAVGPLWDMPDGVSLLSHLGAFGRMEAGERAALKRSEIGSHLAALADGERRAVTLAGESLLLSPDDADDQRWFLGTLLADEAKHSLTLRRFLRETLARASPPHPALAIVFSELSRERDYALNLLVGQVVLEGAAASLLSSLLVSTHHPLLREMLRRIGRDEARHMRFARMVNVSEAQPLSRERHRRMEEVLFEAAWAATASLVAEHTWVEFDLNRPEARRVTVDALRERGVLLYYSHIVLRQLVQRGFPAKHLGERLEQQLEDRLREGL